MALVLLLALLSAPGLIPAEVYRAPVQANASLSLGREVTLTGPMSVRLLPRIEVRAKVARIGHPPEFSALLDQQTPAFAEMEELRAAIRIWPLLFGDTEVEELVLIKPRLHLVRLADGRNNWTFNLPPPKSDAASAWIGRLDIIGGSARFEDRSSGTVRTVSDLNLQARMPSPDRPLVVEMSGRGERLELALRGRLETPRALLDEGRSALTLDLEGESLSGRIEGDLALGARPDVDVAFDLASPDLAAILEEAGLSVAVGRNALGAIKTKGRLFGPFDDLTVKIERARMEGPLLEAEASGEVRAGAQRALMLRAEARSEDPAGLARALGVPGPPPGDLGETRLAATLVGEGEEVRFEGLKLSHDGRLAKLTYEGAGKLSGAFSHSGALDLTVPSLRDLSGAMGLSFPPGDGLQALSLRSAISGGLTRVTLDDLDLSLDQITARGDLALETGARPRLSGQLETGVLNLSAYIASSLGKGRGPDAGGWSTTPIDIAFLKRLDLDLAVTSEGLVHDGFVFGPSDLGLALTDGRLTARLTRTSLFGGEGEAQFTLGAGGAEQADATLTARFSGLSLKPFLTAAARFDRLEGAGDVELDLKATGASLQAAMSSLSGAGRFRLSDGALKGIDLVGVSRLGRARSPSSGGLLGESARTRFETLEGRFEASKGIATTRDLRLAADGATVTGQGQLDMGGRSLDLTLFSELKTGGGGLRVPVRVKGEWSRVRVSIDSAEALRQAAGAVRGRVTREVERAVRPSPASPAPAAPGRTAPRPAPGAAPADRLKREIDRLFAGAGDPG
jgi:AsmA protein